MEYERKGNVKRSSLSEKTTVTTKNCVTSMHQQKAKEHSADKTAATLKKQAEVQQRVVQKATAKKTVHRRSLQKVLIKKTNIYALGWGRAKKLWRNQKTVQLSLPWAKEKARVI